MPPTASPQGPPSGAIPPLPPGFTLDQPQQSSGIPPQQSSGIPPLPPGYTLDQPSAGQSGIPPLPPGFTLDQPQQSGPEDTSYGSALQEGAHEGLSGLGSTVSTLAKDIGWKGGQNAGKALQNAVPAPANYQSASGDLLAKLKAGQIVGALRDLPRAAVEGAPSVIGGLGAAAAGAALAPEAIGGAAVGSALGAAGYGAASDFGQDAQARAAANGHATPTLSDQLAAGATAAAQGGLNAVGLGRVPGVSTLLAKSPAFLHGLAAAGLDAAGQGAANVVGQVGTTAGTTQGLTVDPDQAVAAALQGAAGRAGVQAAGGTLGAAGSAAGAVGNGIKAFGTYLASRDFPAMTDTQAASFNRINAAYDAQAPAQPNASPVARMNALWKTQASALQQTIDGAIKTGQVDDPTGAALKTALQQAAVHKSALDTNLLNRLNSSAVDPQLAATLRNGLVDLDHLSQMVNAKQTTGPFAALASKITAAAAPIGAVVAGVAGDWRTAAELGVGSMLGHGGGLAGKIGAAAGGVLDRVAGTNLPQSLILRSQALRQAQAAGLDTSTDAVSSVQSAADALSGLRTQQAQAAADAAARAKAANLQEAAANQVSGMAYRQSPEGIIARANMAVRKKDILTQALADGRLQQPMSQDEQDRVSIGLSPRDPIPANVPLNAAGQPISQSAPALRPGIQPVQPQSAPLGHQPPAVPAPSQPQSGQLPVGWLDHYRTQLVANGLAPTNDTIGRALGGAVASGRITQELADHLLANPTQFLGDRSVPFQHLVNVARENAGQAPNPVVAPVQSQPKYMAAVQTYQNLGNTLANQAEAAGDVPLMLSIARIMAASSGQQKADIANQELAQRSHDAVALARAKSLLPPELLKGR